MNPLDAVDNVNQTVNTELEQLVTSCNRIRAIVAHACSVVMFSDIKHELKEAKREVDNVKRRIAHGNVKTDVFLQKADDMDDEDREFITQMFMNVRYRGERKQTVISQKTVNYSSVIGEVKQYGFEEIEKFLTGFGSKWNFDIGLVSSAANSSVHIIGKYLMQTFGLIESLGTDLQTVDRLFHEVEKGYRPNPYHNAQHAADVTHSMVYFIRNSDIQKYCTELDTISMILAAVAHDIGHPGVTNRYLVNTRDDIALVYNDSSVLENMHTASLFKLLQQPENNVLATLATDDWNDIRKNIIGMILATDMNRHFGLVGTFKTRAQTLKDIMLDNTEDKMMLLQIGLKCADLGHSAKSLKLHQRWTTQICEEFFLQGDLEKQQGLQVSMYCDRENTDIAKSQAGFIKNICLPLYEIFCNFLDSPKITDNCYDQLNTNLEHWSKASHRQGSVVAQAPNHRPPKTNTITM